MRQPGGVGIVSERTQQMVRISTPYDHHGQQDSFTVWGPELDGSERTAGRCGLSFNSGPVIMYLYPTPAEMRALAAALNASADLAGAAQ